MSAELFLCQRALGVLSAARQDINDLAEAMLGLDGCEASAHDSLTSLAESLFHTEQRLGLALQAREQESRFASSVRKEQQHLVTVQARALARVQMMAAARR